MRFLADESCDFAAVRALRAAGHEVVAVSETMPGADDLQVLRIARRRRCVLLTEDKDFGQLVFADRRAMTGVVLIRFPAGARATFGEAIVQLATAYGQDLRRSYVVLRPGRMRIHAAADRKRR
jgi:predicted nuclease of predicted toxin-antitoxin system